MENDLVEMILVGIALAFFVGIVIIALDIIARIALEMFLSNERHKRYEQEQEDKVWDYNLEQYRAPTISTQIKSKNDLK